MSITEQRSVAPWELGLIAATRGMIGFGAGLLLADKVTKDRRKMIGWSLFLSGLVSTVPIALHVFGKKQTNKVDGQDGQVSASASEETPG